MSSVLQWAEAIAAAIPAETVAIRLLGRHSLAEQEGDERTRTLTSDGVVLCQQVGTAYDILFELLSERFGDPTIFASTAERSLMTAKAITGAEQITQDPQLDLLASLKQINGGEWYAAHKAAGHTITEIVLAFLEDAGAWADQPWGDNRKAYLDWIADAIDVRFKVAWAHEVMCSMAADDHIDEDQLGLNECEGFLFCLDEAGRILTVIKVVPPLED